MVIKKTSEMTSQLKIKANRIKLDIISQQINQIVECLEDETEKPTNEELTTQLFNIADFANQE